MAVGEPGLDKMVTPELVPVGVLQLLSVPFMPNTTIESFNVEDDCTAANGGEQTTD
jgi:hypothetical protein